MTVTEALQQARALNVQERKELMKLLIDTLDMSAFENKHSILEFEGVAAHLADNEDPQDYINRMRSEWDDRP